ncbi:MAG TPA: HAD family hydrolase [Egibacteraceae bacterium]|jgi:HAD superfamily hydrolase (TIGR01490 family)|nr:HAD family hydrolase [Egibacteraceae bacterium]
MGDSRDAASGASAAARPGRQAAFFDLDKTVVARSSTLAFGRELYRERMITPAVVIKGAYAQLAYSLLGANDERMERARIALLELTKGWEAERLQRLVRETLQEVIDPLIYEEALELFEEHRRAGRDLYLVSSSGIEVVRPLAEYLGVPHVLATTAGIDAEGRYDGTLEFYCFGEHKATALREEAAARGIDLAASYAYSDSVTDVPMLSAVGHPVAVNADRELRAVAAERGWQIVDFARPVALRSRLSHVPRPPAEVVAGAGALSAIALAGWVVYQRRGASGLGARVGEAARAVARRPPPTRPGSTLHRARPGDWINRRRPATGALLDVGPPRGRPSGVVERVRSARAGP